LFRATRYLHFYLKSSYLAFSSPRLIVWYDFSINEYTQGDPDSFVRIITFLNISFYLKSYLPICFWWCYSIFPIILSISCFCLFANRTIFRIFSIQNFRSKSCWLWTWAPHLPSTDCCIFIRGSFYPALIGNIGCWHYPNHCISFSSYRFLIDGFWVYY
jgi:hypothetical protein